MMGVPAVGALAVTIVAVLADAAKGIVGRVLVALGFGVVTAVGLNAALNSVLFNALDFNAGNVQFAATIQAVGIPWFISTIVSAVTTRITLSGLTSDGLSFWIMRKRLN